MRKLYPCLSLFFLLTSCMAQVNYLGNSYPSTANIDVFVSRSAVSKPFEVIGKGYVQSAVGETSVERIQRQAVVKGKQKGAHAVIIEDYFVVDNSTSVATSLDSAGKGSRVAKVDPALAPNFTILFIRYKE